MNQTHHTVAKIGPIKGLFPAPDIAYFFNPTSDTGAKSWSTSDQLLAPVSDVALKKIGNVKCRKIPLNMGPIYGDPQSSLLSRISDQYRNLIFIDP